VNVPRDPRTRLATSAVSQATSLAIARTLLLRALDVEVVEEEEEDSNLVVDLKSATSAQRSVTSLVTAPRLADTVVVVEDSVATRVDMVVALADVEVEVVVELEARPVTLVEDMDTCPVIAPRVKSATTVVKSDISPETVPPRPLPSELATSASSPVTSRLNAPTKFLTMNTIKTESETITRETNKQHHILRTNPGHFERVACS